MYKSTFATREHLYMMAEGELMLTSTEKQYDYKIKDLPAEEKPREKLAKYGPGALSTAELLAIIMGVGTKKEDVLAMSKRLLKEYGETAILNEKDPRKLEVALGLPATKASQLIATFELGRRFFKTSGRSTSIRTPRQVFEYVKDMRDLPKEHLRGIYLDAHYRVVRDETISIGSITANIVHPREVFRPALEYGASALILVHNHPSGIVTPSGPDVAVTKQLIEAGKIMGVHLLDHVIVGGSKFASVPAEYDV